MRAWQDRLRRLTAGVGASAAALALTVWGASPASAGGPTSVLVVSPESEETASLYHSDQGYAELERLLGPAGKGTRERPPEAVSASARLINVTWMVHDVTPWRVDRVFMGDADKDVWIHTAAHPGDAPNGLWHRAEHPRDVRTFLFALGVMGETAGSGSAPGIYPGPWETESAGPGTERDTAVSGTPAAAGAGDGADWWWAIPGVAVGAALALVLRPYVKRWPAMRRQKGDPGPRQELLDV
ncbi:hypothetical protein ABZX82_01025 [Streptomyces griseoflavus]|uniref:hypothetical protein n=1 Tax=Streptomyces griseoflavus TaxID=35619 RepID=UPI0033A8042D